MRQYRGTDSQRPQQSAHSNAHTRHIPPLMFFIPDHDHRRTEQRTDTQREYPTPPAIVRNACARTAKARLRNTAAAYSLLPLPLTHPVHSCRHSAADYPRALSSTGNDPGCSSSSPGASAALCAQSIPIASSARHAHMRTAIPTCRSAHRVPAVHLHLTHRSRTHPQMALAGDPVLSNGARDRIQANIRLEDPRIYTR